MMARCSGLLSQARTTLDGSPFAPHPQASVSPAHHGPYVTKPDVMTRCVSVEPVGLVCAKYPRHSMSCEWRLAAARRPLEIAIGRRPCDVRTALIARNSPTHRGVAAGAGPAETMSTPAAATSAITRRPVVIPSFI